uniref:Uncharacterized protein n=1 Tax=Anguilla anguilla TaxID=7936 RepID=A0A0E9WC73_ANGAN
MICAQAVRLFVSILSRNGARLKLQRSPLGLSSSGSYRFISLSWLI